MSKQVIAIIGHSKGGTAALIYNAVYDNDVPTIIGLAPKYDWSTETNYFFLERAQ
jgi:S-formylglutathione hydrolase FrmB